MRKALILFTMAMTSLLSSLCAQQNEITGKVVDNQGEPIIGVNVTVEGTSEGAITNLDGQYKLRVSSEAVLVFSFVGYETQKVEVGNRSIIDVTLAENTELLNEVVVTGYTTQSTLRSSGSVAKVDGSTIANVPVASFDKILQGQAAGVQSLSSSGQPGSSASVLIRGASSLIGSTQPLYVLDGVQISAAEFETLNPNDIESVSVLKDASSSAIYGSRASNGVIVITTKSGKSGKAKFAINAQYGISEPPAQFYEVMNSQQKIDFELQTGGTFISGLSEQELNELRQIDTDWNDELFEQATTANVQLSVSGGSENTTYYISGSVYSEDGVSLNTGLDRFTSRFNIKTSKKGLTIGTNTTLGYSQFDGTPEGNRNLSSPLSLAFWTNPYEPVFNADGTYNNIRGALHNGVQAAELNRRNSEFVKIVSSAFAEFEIPNVEGLSLKTNWGVDYSHAINTTYIHPDTKAGGQSQGNEGSLSRGYSRNARFTGTNSLNYSTNINTDHTLDVGIFQEFVWSDFESFGFTGFGLSSDLLRNEAGITAGTSDNGFIPSVGGSGVQSALVSYFGNLAYTYKDRYTFNATYRVDGSSRFGPNNQFASFYSLGVTWNLSEEEFFNIEAVDKLKLKASYGTVGNQGVGNFLFSPNLTTLTYAGEPGLVSLRIPNPDLAWETTNMFNVGVEYGLFENKITGSVEYYNNITNDIFLNEQLSRTTGVSTRLANIGQLRNSGWEFVLSATLIDKDDLKVSVGGNAAYNDNVVEDLGGQEEIISGSTITRVGHPLGSNYVVPYLGVNPINGDALYLNAAGEVTNQFNLANDARIYGPRTAPWTGGVTLNIDYKNFSLFALGSWISGSTVFNFVRADLENPTFFTDNISTRLLDAWKEPGDVTSVPRIQTVDGLTTSQYFTETTRNLEDGDFFRLRNVVLSYTLPQEWLSKIKLSSARIYAQGQNLLTFTRYTGADPENADGFFLGAVYPAVRTYTLGLDLTF